MVAGMPIRALSETMINQIAAGEVIERPASVVKELVENALDAGATRIEIMTGGGGLGLVRVVDNGCGIAADELALAVSRHCTSKLSGDIQDIRSLGFRGEALPSIGSVSRLVLRSRVADARDGAEIAIEGGRVAGVRPAACAIGSLVEVRDLFHATPARLKFVKGERAESAAIADVVKRIAAAFPHVRFTLSGSDRTTLDLASTDGADTAMRRIADVLGKEFPANALPVDALREGIRLSGHVSIPSFTRANALHQYAFVNGRPVRDRLIAGALRGAFSDVLPRDRHPVAALFLQLDPTLVDVNVHPAKADVRFRDPDLVRGLIVGAIREVLARSGVRAATTSADAMVSAFRVPATSQTGTLGFGASGRSFAVPAHAGFDSATSVHRPLGFEEEPQTAFAVRSAGAASDGDEAPASAPLGVARAQVHETYIIAQTADSLIIVDQHAAHERLVYEALKQAAGSRPVAAQMLLLPDIVDMAEEDVERISNHSQALRRMGLGVERFGPGALVVRETPAVLGKTDTARLLRDIADELAEHEHSDTLSARMDRIAATMACHGSVRSGRRLVAEEMNALLRQMEATPGSGTCNHGRPTFIELKLKDIERLFGRR